MQLSSKRILVIDDEDDIREVATLTLETFGGFEVISAGSGKEGVERAAAEHPDVILLDVMMPDMDGPETLTQLRLNPTTSGIPIIFLTAKVQAADHRRLSQLGAAAILAKPFDPDHLSDDINLALGWHMGESAAPEARTGAAV